MKSELYALKCNDCKGGKDYYISFIYPNKNINRTDRIQDALKFDSKDEADKNCALVDNCDTIQIC